MLSAKRDVSAAQRFLKKVMRADRSRLTFTISVDKNAAHPGLELTGKAGEREKMTLANF